MLNTVNTAAFLLLVKIAQADGIIDPSEKELLLSFAEDMSDSPSIDEMAQLAAQKSVQELCSELSREEDRFFIRLRCHLMVMVDGEVDSAEQKMLEEVIVHLSLNTQLEGLLDEVLDHQLSGAEEPDMVKIQALYEKSSFAQ